MIGQSFDQVLFLLVGRSIEVVATEVLIHRSILEHVIDGGKHRSSDRADCLFSAAAGTEAVELGPVVAVLLMRGSPSTLH